MIHDHFLNSIIQFSFNKIKIKFKLVVIFDSDMKNNIKFWNNIFAKKNDMKIWINLIEIIRIYDIY